MTEVKNMKVEIIDDDHIFVNNRQFISLSRFVDAKMDMAKEVNALLNKHRELIKENESLKMLLKTHI